MKIKNGVIHAHTENSARDSALSPTKLCERAAELGAPAVVLTDHGVLTGVYEFLHAAEANGIKAIPGVEAYVKEDGSLTKEEHFLLIAKNYKGYHAIMKAVTAANVRFSLQDENTDTKFRVASMNVEILNKYFGKGSSGHGNVFATSACIGGVLSRILLQNEDLDAKAAVIEGRQARFSTKKTSADEANEKSLEEIGKQIADMIVRRDSLAKIAAKKFGSREKSLAAMAVNNPSEYEAKKAELDADKKATEEAAAELKDLKSDIAKSKKTETIIRKKVKEAQEKHDKFMAYQEEIDEIKSKALPENQRIAKATEAALMYRDIFGEGNFFIELQNHGIKQEAYVMPILAKIAHETGIPVVACNDVHYANASENDVLARQILMSLRFGRYQEFDETDKEYYIKTDDELSSYLKMILDEDTVNEAMDNIGVITSACNVVFPTGLHNPVFVSQEGEDGVVVLRKLAHEGIEWRFPKRVGWTDEYEERLKYELNVIEKLGYSSYLCIVEDFLRYGRKLGTDNEERVGLGIGPGRGSAVGSLVCYLVGITGIDPIKYGLIFERFLNEERVSQPDIDSDFKTDIRERVLDYVKDRYGKDAVCGIVTKGTSAAKASVKSVARFFDWQEGTDERKYFAIGDEVANAIPAKPGITFADVEEDVTEKFKANPDALKVFDTAKLIEGAITQYGVHAAGVIIADNGDVSDYVPLMWNENKEQMACQCTKGEVEDDAGLLKMDFLGLRNLNIITEALRMIQRNYGISLDMEEIGRSLVDGKTTKYDVRGNVFDDIFATGKTNSVFQFESGGMKSMLKSFKPSNIEDVILLVAAYRPGPMQFIPEITNVKHGKAKPKYIVPQMKDILEPTYGKPIYQEQIMAIFNKIAGFSLGEADIIRRAMAKKKLKELVKYHDKFIDGMKTSGAKEADAEAFWTELLEFSKYAFNKSHACAYAFVAYYTAWLKLNYPTEYMTAALNYSAADKVQLLVAECKSLGIKVLPPDVNRSGIDFKCVKEGEILFGLKSVKSIKAAADSIIAERDNKRFVSFKDFVVRAHVNKTVAENLIKCGAMDAWCNNRNAMLDVLEGLSKDSSKIQEKKDTVAERTALLLKEAKLDTLPQDVETLRDKKGVNKKTIDGLLRARKSLSEYEARFNQTMLPINIPETKLQRLNNERELLGIYVSGHPLDEYAGLDVRTSTIMDADAGEVTLCGTLENVRYTNRKSDGKEMAFFTLTDESGEIEVCCFTKAFEKYGVYVVPNAVLAVTGECKAEKSSFVASTSDEEESSDEATVYKLYMQSAKSLERRRPTVVVTVKDLVEWTENVYNQVKEYSGIDYDIIVYDNSLGEFRKTDNMSVSALILESDLDIRPFEK